MLLSDTAQAIEKLILWDKDENAHLQRNCAAIVNLHHISCNATSKFFSLPHLLWLFYYLTSNYYKAYDFLKKVVICSKRNCNELKGYAKSTKLVAQWKGKCNNIAEHGRKIVFLAK